MNDITLDIKRAVDILSRATEKHIKDTQTYMRNLEEKIKLLDERMGKMENKVNSITFDVEKASEAINVKERLHDFLCEDDSAVVGTLTNEEIHRRMEEIQKKRELRQQN